MTRKVRIAAVQLPSYQNGQTNAEKWQENLKAAENWLEKAGRSGADIACLGEHYNAMGQEITAENLLKEIHGIVEETVERLGAAARRFHMYLIAPVWGSLDGIPSNAALLLDRDGCYVGAYRKVHPTSMERELGLVPGDSWPTFNLDFGCIGIQICHDNSFPESARSLALNGAELIFWPHVMSGWGGEFMSVLMRSPAIYNGIHHIPVSFGCEPDRSWRPGMLIGHTSIIAPDGIVIADAGRYPGVASAEIDLDRPRIAHDFTRAGDHIWRADMLNDRRPDTYQPITRPLDQLE